MFVVFLTGVFTLIPCILHIIFSSTGLTYPDSLSSLNKIIYPFAFHLYRAFFWAEKNRRSKEFASLEYHVHMLRYVLCYCGMYLTKFELNGSLRINDYLSCSDNGSLL